MRKKIIASLIVCILLVSAANMMAAAVDEPIDELPETENTDMPVPTESQLPQPTEPAVSPEEPPIVEQPTEPPQTTTPAPDPNQTPEPDETPMPDTSVVLVIDNAHIYDGMDIPYSSGYVPTASNGIAKVVLPLIATESIKDNMIIATVDLGEPSASPFQFGNYEKSIPLQANYVDGGTNIVESYLVSVDIPLAANRELGNFPIVFKIIGALHDGTPFAQDFTVFVTISDGIDPNATPSPEPQMESGSTGGEEAPVPEVKTMLTNYSINPSPVLAGDSLIIKATITNTNENQSMNNIKISVAGESTDLLFTGDDTGSYYFESLAPQESLELEMNMAVAQNSEAVPQKLNLDINYEGKKATPYKSAENITIPIAQPIRLEYDSPTIPDEVNAGDTISVSINVMNLGLGTVHNARMTLDAQGLIPEKTTFIGNIESGTAKKGDMYVFVGTKDTTDSNNSSDDKYGLTDGSITLLYEDEYGKEYSEVFDINTTINPPVISVAETEEPEDLEEDANTYQWWISIIIIGAIIAVIIIINSINKKKLQKKIEEYESA